MTNETEDGGFLIPKIAYIDVVKDGLFWRCVRWIGQKIINFGAWFRSLGYTQKEFHPYDEILDSIRKVRNVT